jgi:hypothetical protein
MNNNKSKIINDARRNLIGSDLRRCGGTLSSSQAERRNIRERPWGLVRLWQLATTATRANPIWALLGPVGCSYMRLAGSGGCTWCHDWLCSWPAPQGHRAASLGMVAAFSTPVVVGRCRPGCGGSWDPTPSFGGGPTDDESGVTWQQAKTEPRPRSWRTMMMLLSVITLLGSYSLVSSLHPFCSGGNPDLDLLDWTMAAPNVVTPLEGIIFRGVSWLEWCRGGSVERLVFYCIDDDRSSQRGVAGSLWQTHQDGCAQGRGAVVRRGGIDGTRL